MALWESRTSGIFSRMERVAPFPGDGLRRVVISSWHKCIVLSPSLLREKQVDKTLQITLGYMNSGLSGEKRKTLFPEYLSDPLPWDLMMGEGDAIFGRGCGGYDGFRIRTRTYCPNPGVVTRHNSSLMYSFGTISLLTVLP